MTDQDMNTPETAQAFEALVASRYSCRAFLPTPVTRETVTAILATAQRTPSWCNTQPWHVHITGPEATRQLGEALASPEARDAGGFEIAPPAEYVGVFRDRRRESGLQLYKSVGIARDDQAGSARQMARNFEFFGAPHVAIVTTETSLGTYGVLDCGAFINAFVLAARSHGVASIAQASLAARSGFLRSWFGIPEHRQIVCGISFGYEDASHPVNGFRTTRVPVDEACSWFEGR